MLRPFILFLFSTSLILGHGQSAGIETLADKASNEVVTQPDAEWPLYPCGTPYPSSEEVIKSKMDIDEWLAQNTTRDNDPVHVLVAWHVVYSSTNAGYLSEVFIENSIDRINQEYNPYEIYFTLDTITYHQNDDWYYNVNGSNNGEVEEEMRSSTYIDPVHYYNIWTVDLTGTGAGGWNYFPNWSLEDSYWQGTTMDIGQAGGNRPDVVHEIGHYFMLYHTFQFGCDPPGDSVDDTPYQDDNDTYSCSESTDTCPDDLGNDPVHNFMNYSSASCRTEFTEGQIERAFWAIETYHPGLLENPFYYPNLYLGELNYQMDNDGDGVFNPGESVRLRVNVGNYWGAVAEEVILTLSSSDPRITISDSMIYFNNTIGPGVITFTLLDWFEVHANEDAALGNIPCTIHITTSDTVYPYENIEETFVALSLNQYGYPTDNYTIKSSPIIADLDGNGLKEIYFGSDNGSMYATMIGGLDVAGFPFETNDDVRSSPAVGDVDGDGQEELVFGSKDGNLYIVSSTGSQELAYNQSGYIIGAAALANLDGDNDLEIVFATQSSSNGKVFAIHHDGSDVTGFPVDIAEKVIVGPAVADLENDGVMDIVAVSWDNHIHVFDANGAVKTGFPFETSNRFNSPATLVDLDGDGDLEIVAGNDNGNLYVLHHDATIMAEFDTGDDIRGGIAVADLESNGSLELLFTGYDDHVHVWDPVTNTELAGWPIDIGSNSLTGPVAADLDNDGDLEVVTSTKSGNIHAFHHDGTPLTQFPFTVAGNIESTPAIGDLDNDGDFELIFGTTMGLQVIDVKSEAGEVASWKLHRGNRHRSGYYGLTLAAVDPDEMITPLAFHVSRNYPNPFNPITTFRVTTAEQSKLEVSVYDVSGRLVNRLINDNMDAGIHTVQWDGRNQSGYFVPAGVYFLQVISGENQHVQKMALIK